MFFAEAVAILFYGSGWSEAMFVYSARPPPVAKRSTVPNYRPRTANVVHGCAVPSERALVLQHEILARVRHRWGSETVVQKVQQPSPVPTSCVSSVRTASTEPAAHARGSRLR